jgi:cytochrome c oxidase assembly protein subunit 15
LEVLYDRSVPVGRFLLRLVDVLPLPSLRTQRLVAAAVVLSQGGIAVTGAIVRVTASGLGCPTWPQCFPGSFVPVPHAEVAVVHQVVEFGNRMITFLVVLTAALAVLAVTRARRRREVLVYAWLMPASTIVQAVIGGITVLTGLLWWTVAIHLVASMTMVWLAVQLYYKVGEPDEGVAPTSPVASLAPTPPVASLAPSPVVPKPLRQLTALTAVVLAAQLVSGTLVTGAGPHAGDKSAEQPVPRLQVEITTLVHLHTSLLIAYLTLIVGLGFSLSAVRAPKPVVLRLRVLLALVCAQGTVGTVQFFTGVPAALVAVHVAGAAACTAATAALWASMRERAEPEPVEG